MERQTAGVAAALLNQIQYLENRIELLKEINMEEDMERHNYGDIRTILSFLTPGDRAKIKEMAIQTIQDELNGLLTKLINL